MAVPTRYLSGVSTQSVTQSLGNFPLPNPSAVYLRFDDFNQYRAADWTVTTGANAGTAASVNGPGGLIALTTAAVSTADYEHLNAAPLDITFNYGQQVWHTTQLKISEIVTSSFFTGIIAGAPGPTIAPTDGIYLRKLSGVSTIDLVLVKASISTVVTLPAIYKDSNGVLQPVLTANTNVKLGFYFNGKDTVSAFVNDYMTGSQTILTNLPVGILLSQAMGLVNGSAVAKTLTVDWALSSQDR